MNSEASRIECVQIDGLVLLKIIQHSKQNMPEVVTGQLLGLEYDEGILEVTNCFPMPNNDDDDQDDYQLAMMKYLRTVNVDNNTVGWYQSAFLGSGNFLHKSIIDAQYHFQKEVPSSVVVVHDPFRTTAGSLAIKAYRLTNNFMTMYSKGNFSSTAFTKFNVETDEIFEEVRIKVHNAHLVHGFLYELREKKEMSCAHERLNVNTHPNLEKTLDYLGQALDDYGQEQSKFNFYIRQLNKQKAAQDNYLKKQAAINETRLSEGKPALPKEDLSKNSLFKSHSKPSRLDSVLLSNQISHFCKNLEHTSRLGLNKLYVTESLQEKVDANGE